MFFTKQYIKNTKHNSCWWNLQNFDSSNNLLCKNCLGGGAGGSNSFKFPFF